MNHLDVMQQFVSGNDHVCPCGRNLDERGPGIIAGDCSVERLLPGRVVVFYIPDFESECAFEYFGDHSSIIVEFCPGYWSEGFFISRIVFRSSDNATKAFRIALHSFVVSIGLHGGGVGSFGFR
jgi:hypothetical protein